LYTYFFNKNSNGDREEWWGPVRLIGRIYCLICGGARYTGISQFSTAFEGTN